MRITKIESVHYDEPIPVYDVVKAQPNHNFVVAANGHLMVIHNCGML